jgi:chromate transport protein ChrA
MVINKNKRLVLISAGALVCWAGLSVLVLYTESDWLKSLFWGPNIFIYLLLISVFFMLEAITKGNEQWTAVAMIVVIAFYFWQRQKQ